MLIQCVSLNYRPTLFSLLRDEVCEQTNEVPRMNYTESLNQYSWMIVMKRQKWDSKCMKTGNCLSETASFDLSLKHAFYNDFISRWGVLFSDYIVIPVIHQHYFTSNSKKILSWLFIICLASHLQAISINFIHHKHDSCIGKLIIGIKMDSLTTLKFFHVQ